MKTTRILLLAASFLLYPWCASQLLAQQSDAKKVVITKRIIEPNGDQSTITIVKKGAVAENFDVEKYIRENRSENTQIEVNITGGDEESSIVVKGSRSNRAEEVEEQEEQEERDEAEASEEAEYRNNGQQYPGYEGYSGYNGYSGYSNGGDDSPFLGVNEDSDEDAKKPGLVVNVVRGSAADQAGLRDNDKIMKLNDTPINQWSDLSKFVNAAKVGDKIRISYERNGKAASTEATLTKRDEVKCDTKCTPIGFLGVSDREERAENDEPGVEVSITDGSSADKAGLRDGDVIFQLDDAPIADFEDISDFMAYTKPGDKIAIVYERNGQRNTVETTLSAQNNSWAVNSGNWDLEDLDPEVLLNKIGWNNGNCTVNVVGKDACLGVISDDFSDGDTEGSQINDFSDESAAREVNMAKGDIITALNGQRIKGHQDLWDEVAKYKIGDKVKVEYLRDGKTQRTEVTLKACQDNSSRVQILDGDGEQVRNFTSWNWNSDDQRRLRERSIITIRRGEGDAPKLNPAPANQPLSPDRSLKLTEFRVFPNPTQGQVTVEFSGASVATTVSFFDLSGRQLFREELNAFDGKYSQQFDLAEYAKGTIVVHIQQGEKVFTEQVIVN